MSAPRRVAVNLSWLAPGRVGGSEEYLVRQLGALLAAEPDAWDLRVICQPGFGAAHPELAGRVTLVPTPGQRDWRGSRIVAEHTWMRGASKSAELVHHGGGTMPVGGRRPALVTVHDIQYRTFPQYFSAARRAYLAAMVPRSVRRAARVAVPSRFVAESLTEAFGIEPATTIVVPHGIPDLARPTSDAIAASQARHDIDGRYVIYPAITHPHKGHATLVEMLRATQSSGHPLGDIALVLLGGAGAAEATLHELVAAAGVGERLIRPGRVSAADRDALVAGAEALVFPSEYEGFGAPLVEAMALGTPVVCSSQGAVVEVVGAAGLVVAAATGDAWADAIARAIDQRDELVAAGQVRRRVFSLDASGSALADAYTEALEASPSESRGS